VRTEIACECSAFNALTFRRIYAETAVGAQLCLGDVLLDDEHFRTRSPLETLKAVTLLSFCLLAFDFILARKLLFARPVFARVFARGGCQKLPEFSSRFHFGQIRSGRYRQPAARHGNRRSEILDSLLRHA
jgi:hypothetical protein